MRKWYGRARRSDVSVFLHELDIFVAQITEWVVPYTNVYFILYIIIHIYMIYECLWTYMCLLISSVLLYLFNLKYNIIQACVDFGQSLLELSDDPKMVLKCEEMDRFPKHDQFDDLLWGGMFPHDKSTDLICFGMWVKKSNLCWKLQSDFGKKLFGTNKQMRNNF